MHCDDTCLLYALNLSDTDYRSLQVISRSKAEKFKESLIPPSLETKESYAEWLNSRDKRFLNASPKVRYTIVACVDTLKVVW